MTPTTVSHSMKPAPFLVPEPAFLLDEAYPRHAIAVPPGVHRSGRYAVRFATSVEDLRAAQRLRFEVFNVELREGLSDSYATGLDIDAYDRRCHHLLVLEESSGKVVGTYRLMISELTHGQPFYTESEFDLGGIPDQVLRHGAEVGRACVAKEHRNGRVLQLLWRGIARYLDWNDKRFVFGCCSVPSLDTAEIAGISVKLASEGHLHPRYRAAVLPGLRSAAQDTVVARPHGALPPLFASYLRLGAKVCGGPAFDRDFCVTDYFVVLDLRDVAARLLANLAAPGWWQSSR